MTKHIRIDYVVKPDIVLDELKGAIAEFVTGIRAHHPEHVTHRINTRQILCGSFILASSLGRSFRTSRSSPFFLRFTAGLKEQCGIGPDVTRLDPVASTNLIERRIR